MADNKDLSYQAALAYLKRGLSQKQIADRLVQDGFSRSEANETSAKVWRENSLPRKTNAKILLGFGVFLVFVGISLMLIRYVSSGEIPPILSFTYIFFIMAFYLFYRGWRGLKTA